MSEGAPVRLAQADVEDVVDVLSDAFRGYPVMRYVLQDSPGYARDLPTLVRFFVMARFLRGEPLLGVHMNGRMAGVALVSFPENQEAPPSLGELRRATWEALGDSARKRYEAFGEATAPFFEGIPRTHLNMIGVREEAQGLGLGRSLLEAVNALGHGRPYAEGITLTTEKPANVGLYEKFGFEVIGHARVAPSLTTWGMMRRNHE